MKLPWILATGLLLSGCFSFGFGGPKTYDIKAEGAPILNRDASGRSLSVVVRVLQLKSSTEFSRLTFDTLAEGRPESELLGNDLLARSDVVMVPGGSYRAEEKLLEGTKYVGVVAFFRNPDPHYWRFLLDADRVRKKDLKFRVEDCYIEIIGIEPLVIPGQPKGGQPQCQSYNSAPFRSSSQPGTKTPSSSPPAKKF